MAEKTTEKKNYKDLLNEKEYSKLLLSNLVNRFGDSLDAIAFTWLIYHITQSASWAVLIFGLNVLPNIIVQPFAGPIIEKMDKKKIIVLTHLARGIIITGFVLIYMYGKANPFIMAGFTLLITTIESFNLPAAGAFVPMVVKKENLSHAMSLNSSLSSAVSLVGTGAAGIIIAKFGVQFTMMIDAATFFIAMIGILSIRNYEDNKPAAEEAKKEQKAKSDFSYKAMLKDGFKYVLGNKLLVNFAVMAVLMNFLLVPLNALQAPVAEDVFGLGSELLSVMGMAASLGAIIGSAITPALIERFKTKNILFSCGVLMGSFMTCVALGQFVSGMMIAGYMIGGICYFVMSGAASVLCGVVSIQFVNVCDRAYLARAGAVMGALSAAAMPLASILVSCVLVKLSPLVLIVGCGVTTVALMIIVMFSKMEFDAKKIEVPNAA
ncbi:MFS transporter [Butyrivibrio sp. CB08]|uniref:MFS transporter n=1 Tax=Butyrivibrio sp. CB08 TaxID=2364879 RepID=UPI000EAA5447|nr:MFS transporter [Butyrivibrio sp. CB08]RKM56895.1 MFS transporter [Butyrivibrio sp. CB08]